jgi:hypothetical protein
MQFLRIHLPAAILIFVFGYTAVSKLIAQQHFYIIVSSSPLIRERAGLLSWLIPVSELLVVLLLFFPATRRKGFLLGFILLVCFSAYISYLLLWNEKLPCSCGGILEKLGWKEHLLVNLLLMAACMPGLRGQGSSRPAEAG